MTALQRVPEDEYLERVVDLLRDTFSEAASDTREELRPETERQIRKARGYGLETERQIALYVLTAVRIGPEFDVQQAPAREVLNSRQYTPDQKVEWLEAWAEWVLSTMAEAGHL
jgi:hypothetical protein